MGTRDYRKEYAGSHSPLQQLQPKGNTVPVHSDLMKAMVGLQAGSRSKQGMCDWCGARSVPKQDR